MTKMLDKRPTIGGRTDVFVRAERVGQQPAPWVWVIYSAGGLATWQRATQGYRSAEEAWTAGSAVLRQQFGL